VGSVSGFFRVLVLVTRHAAFDGGNVDTTFQHSMCHPKKLSTAIHLFAGIPSERFANDFFAQWTGSGKLRTS